jgi:hypothetical protein
MAVIKLKSIVALDPKVSGCHIIVAIETSRYAIYAFLRDFSEEVLLLPIATAFRLALIKDSLTLHIHLPTVKIFQLPDIKFYRYDIEP